MVVPRQASTLVNHHWVNCCDFFPNIFSGHSMPCWL